LAAKINDFDNPRRHEAMNGPDRAGYWEAMKSEISTLIKLKAWTVVSFTPDMNVLDSTRAFKCKRYPDGNIRKLKARFCTRVFQQVHDTDYFDTFATVVSWTTVRILLVFSVFFDWTQNKLNIHVLFFMHLLQKIYMLACLEVFKKNVKLSNWKGWSMDYIYTRWISSNIARFLQGNCCNLCWLHFVLQPYYNRNWQDFG